MKEFQQKGSLRDDVRYLGNILGKVIKEQEN